MLCQNMIVKLKITWVQRWNLIRPMLRLGMSWVGWIIINHYGSSKNTSVKTIFWKNIFLYVIKFENLFLFISQVNAFGKEVIQYLLKTVSHVLWKRYM